MKHWKSIIIISLALLLNSCIIKSLQPFYTSESLSYNDNLIGNWTDNKKGYWVVESIKEKFEKDKRDGIELNEEDIRTYNTYKDGYYIEYIKDDKPVGFVAMPFKIDDQYYMDFIPLEFEADQINGLALQHLLNTHSVSKLDISSDMQISLTWLDEDAIKSLMKSEKLRLKHEKIGIQEDLLLTASSEELYAFLKKYQQSDIKDKWKSSDRLQLTKSNAKP